MNFKEEVWQVYPKPVHKLGNWTLSLLQWLPLLVMRTETHVLIQCMCSSANDREIKSKGCASICLPLRVSDREQIGLFFRWSRNQWCPSADVLLRAVRWLFLSSSWLPSHCVPIERLMDFSFFPLRVPRVKWKVINPPQFAVWSAGRGSSVLSACHAQVLISFSKGFNPNYCVNCKP